MSGLMPVALLSWKSMRKGALLGFACVRLGRVMRSDNRMWCGLPGKPMLNREGRAKVNDSGKTVYAPVLEWADKEAGNRFSEAVIEAIEAKHPGDLT